MKRAIVLLASAALLWPGWAMAESKTGLGLYVGAGNDQGSLSIPGAPATNYTNTDGGGGGLDFQWRLGDSASLGLFFEAISGESFHCPDCAPGTKPNVWRSEFGLELRAWFTNVFLGLRVGNANEVLAPFNGFQNNTYTANGTAVGATIGWEGSSGVFVKFAYDTASLESKPTMGPITVKVTDNVTSERLYLGYRFKA